jgi:hypothetical protein
MGHRSAQASHLGNIAYMQKRQIDFDPVREEIQPFYCFSSHRQSGECRGREKGVWRMGQLLL